MSVLTRVLSLISGGGQVHISDQLIFNKVIAFRGVTGGVGTSTIVQNVAYAIARNKKIRVCVIDTSFIHPVQHVLLGGKEGSRHVDYLEYRDELTAFSTESKYKNIDIFYMHDRTVVDMIGEKDDSNLFKKFLNKLKSFYDLILIDIGNETTSISTTAGIKANKIILVTDESLKSVYHIQKTLNMLGTLAIPLDKMSKIVLNKKVTDIVTPTAKMLRESKLTVLGEIPLTMRVASKGVTGEIIYDTEMESETIRHFTKVIDDIIESIYSDISLEVKTRVETMADEPKHKIEQNTELFEDLDEITEIEVIELDKEITNNTKKQHDKQQEIDEDDSDNLFNL